MLTLAPDRDGVGRDGDDGGECDECGEALHFPVAVSRVSPSWVWLATEWGDEVPSSPPNALL